MGDKFAVNTNRVAVPPSRVSPVKKSKKKMPEKAPKRAVKAKKKPTAAQRRASLANLAKARETQSQQVEEG